MVKYVRVVEWSAQGDEVRFEMLGEDQETHRLEISAECAPVLLAALAAETEKFKAQDREQQFIRPTGMQTGRTGQGEPMLFMTLPGGAELPLVFKRETLPVLIAELEKLQGAIQPDTQIRWR